MDTETFTYDAKTAGFDNIYERVRSAGEDMGGEHTHDFDARVMVTEGEIAISMGGQKRVYHPGEWCEVAAGTPHAEEIGPAGVKLLVARRG